MAEHDPSQILTSIRSFVIYLFIIPQLISDITIDNKNQSYPSLALNDHYYFARLMLA